MSNREKNFYLPDSGFDEAIDSILEQHEKSPESEELISYEESLKLAKELFAEYETQINDNLQKDVDGWGQPYTDFQDSTRHYTKLISEDITKRYQGHGITRNSSIDQLAGALNIMANKSIKGWSGRLESDPYAAYTKKTAFLILSKCDQSLSKRKKQDGRMKPIFNKIGWEADIGAIVVNTEYYPLMEEFKKMFPDVNIIKANELPEYFQKNTKNSETSLE